MTKLKPITAKWHAFGIQLGIKPDTLTVFEVFTGNVGFYLSEVIRLWRETHPPPKLQVLIDALRYVNHSGLARKLDTDYRGMCKCTNIFVAFQIGNSYYL